MAAAPGTAGRQADAAARAGGGQARRTAKVKEPSPLDLLKLQIADELGLGGKVRELGWGMLTSAESGRIGGVLGRRLRELGLVIGPKGTLLRAQ